MSDSTPRSLREELEIRVVALLTGELSEADADELEKILSVDEELAAYRDRMAAIIGHVHDARDEIAPEEGLRLSAERRAEIFGEDDPYELKLEPAKKEVSFQRRLMEWAAVIAVLFLVGAILIPSVGSVKEVARREVRVEEVAFAAPPPPAEQPGYYALETSIPAELLEGTPQPIKLTPARSSRSTTSTRRLAQNNSLKEQESMSAAVPLDQQSMPSVSLDTVGELAVVAGSGAGALAQAEGDDMAYSDGVDDASDISINIDASAMYAAVELDELAVAADPYAQSRDMDKSLEAEADWDLVASNTSGSDPFGPAPASKPVSARDRNQRITTASLDTLYRSEGVSVDAQVEKLKADGRREFLNGNYDAAAASFADLSAIDPNNAEARLFAKKIDEIKSQIETQTFYKTSEHLLSDVGKQWERPKVYNIAESPQAPNTNDKLESIIIPQVNFSGMPLSRVAAILSELSVEYDPERKGVNIVPLLPEDSDPRVNISLRNLNLDQILQFVTTQVNHKVSILEANNVVTIQPGSNLTQVELHAEARAKNTHQTPKREKQTREEPISTFSLNVSDVSFALAQAALENSRVPNPELIRSEEFLNSFDYGDPTPQPDEPVSLNWEMAEHPYAHGRQVVRFSLQTGAAGRSAGQSLNLNLLVDNSGSMQRPDRRAIMEQSLQSLKDKLQPNDQLNVVLFSRQPKLIANARTPHEQQVAVDLALDYRPEGGTNLEAGLDAAYANAQQNFDPAASNRVILMTDGAANLGEVNAPELAKKVIYNRKQGIALDAYGIGWDDYNDELLEEITRNGDGRYAFLNSAETAADDFAEKLAGSLRVAAADVKVQIVWNPGRVTAYRQVGYDLHQLKTEDFRDNTVDAAEIGEAESGTALYVVQLHEGEEAVGRLGTLHVRYRDPSTNTYKEQEWPLEMPRSIPSLEQASPSLRLATTSALFAERLARNPYAADVSFDELSKLSSDLPQAFPTQQRVVDLQNMIHNARILLGDAK